MSSSIHIVGSRAPGGAENFYVRLVRALHEAGQRVLAVNPPGSAVSQALGEGIAQTHVRMRNVFDLAAMWRIRGLVGASGPTIVQTYMGRATRLTRLPQGRGPIHVARLGGYYDVKGYRHAHAWIGNTRGICDYLIAQGLAADRVFQVGNFVDPAEPVSPQQLADLRRQLAIPEQAWVLASVGRLHPVKGFDILIDAFARLPAEIGGRPVHLVIVGGGELQHPLQTQARQAGVEGRIHWTGWQDRPGAYYRLADLFVCASRQEALGNVILEAWNHGTPVVATRTPGAEGLIDHEGNGLLVPREDPAALAGAIAELLKADDPVRAALARKGAADLAAHHSKAAVVAAYLEVYAELARRSGYGAWV